MDKIDSFKGKYRFLSNFSPSPIYVVDDLYETVEHAYQAMKTIDPEIREKIRNAPTPGAAKRLGNDRTLFELRHSWDVLKFGVMKIMVKKKFKIPELQKKLLDTGDAELIEGNTWNDIYWGVCNGVGYNMLGVILMEIRRDYRKDDIIGSLNFSRISTNQGKY